MPAPVTAPSDAGESAPQGRYAGAVSWERRRDERPSYPLLWGHGSGGTARLGGE